MRRDGSACHSRNPGLSMSDPRTTTSPTSSTATTVTTRIAFDVHFAHDELDQFVTASDAELVSWRSAVDAQLYGTQRNAVNALLESEICNLELPTSPGGQYPAYSEIVSALEDAVTSYNAIPTGLTFDLQDSEPACVRWQWIDGVRVAIYNYTMESTPSGSISGLPSYTWHGVLSFTIK